MDLPPPQVEGDTVTFTFEMKSGREHSTPDRAMWGFACTVRPQESTEDSPTGKGVALDPAGVHGFRRLIGPALIISLRSKIVLQCSLT